MKPETLAEELALAIRRFSAPGADAFWARDKMTILAAARAHLAQLRTVEQPAETEEQAARIVELERRVAELQATLEDEYNISATAEETDNAD